jgi:hypothetical protein
MNIMGFDLFDRLKNLMKLATSSITGATAGEYFRYNDSLR